MICWGRIFLSYSGVLLRTFAVDSNVWGTITLNKSRCGNCPMCIWSQLQSLTSCSHVVKHLLRRLHEHTICNFSRMIHASVPTKCPISHITDSRFVHPSVCIVKDSKGEMCRHWKKWSPQNSALYLLMGVTKLTSKPPVFFVLTVSSCIIGTVVYLTNNVLQNWWDLQTRLHAIQSGLRTELFPEVLWKCRWAPLGAACKASY